MKQKKFKLPKATEITDGQERVLYDKKYCYCRKCPKWKTFRGEK
jgi:hypothetical protein